MGSTVLDPEDVFSRRLIEARVRSEATAKSATARRMFEDLMFLPPPERAVFMHDLDPVDLKHLLRIVRDESGSPFGLWVDDPVGFITDVLGDSIWSKQADAARSVVENKITAVPSAVGMGKTFVASRLTLWHSLVHPVGTAQTVTMAPRFRQVQRLLWPHIRAAADKAALPVEVDQTQMKGYSRTGKTVDLAYGFSAPPTDESAVQGIHHPRLLIVVDEAGGLSRVIGQAMRGILTGEHTRLLAIGNPPTDDEGSWFESLCESPKSAVIELSAYDSPAITGEVVWCLTCPPEVPRHLIGEHMNDLEWIEETIREHGEDSPYVIAKVKAKFPRGGSARAIPTSWVELATETPDSIIEGGQRLCDLDLEDERSTAVVKAGAWVRLGVDVAADGGDEFAITRVVGDLVEEVHASSGADNANPTDVAGVVLEHIRRAEALAARIGSTAPVRVKVDGLGIGWGVVGILQSWKSEGLHNAEIVNVIVSESTGREDPDAHMRPWRKRDEMWLATRALLRPMVIAGEPDEQGRPRAEQQSRLRFRVTRTTVAQLTSPKYGTNASGFTVIETKKSMKERGLRSPDRAESLLLALYEPQEPVKKGTAARIIATTPDSDDRPGPFGRPQVQWGSGGGWS